MLLFKPQGVHWVVKKVQDGHTTLKPHLLLPVSWHPWKGEGLPVSLLFNPHLPHLYLSVQFPNTNWVIETKGLRQRCELSRDSLFLRRSSTNTCNKPRLTSAKSASQWNESRWFSNANAQPMPVTLLLSVSTMSERAALIKSSYRHVNR